jgi:hypothetical protein
VKVFFEKNGLEKGILRRSVGCNPDDGTVRREENTQD